MELRKHVSAALAVHDQSRTWICPECCVGLKDPIAADIWKIFCDPILTMYSNLEESSHNVHFLLNSILKCNREMSDLFIPKAYDHSSPKTFVIREEQYKAFAFWLVGRIFYINGQLNLNQLHMSSTHVQIKCVRAIICQNNHIFEAIFGEYILALQDLLHIKKNRSFGNGAILRRFIPKVVHVCDSLKLTPMYIAVTNEDLARHLTKTILQILEGILDGVTVLSELMFLSIVTVLIKVIKEWDISTQAAALKVATVLYNLKVPHFNGQIAQIFCNCICDMTNNVIPFVCPMAPNDRNFGVIECMFNLFSVILEREDYIIQHSDVGLIKIMWNFLELECMEYYIEQRLELVSLMSSSPLSKLPAHLIDYELAQEKASQMDTFLCAIFSLEHALTSEVLSSFQNYAKNMRDIMSDDLRWSVIENNVMWRSFVNWYSVFHAADLKNFPLYFASVLRVSCFIVEVARKLSASMQAVLLETKFAVQISFFDGVLKPVFLAFVNILETLAAQESRDSSSSSWEMVFHGIGKMLLLQDFSVNIPEKNVTCMVFLSLPWESENGVSWECKPLIAEETYRNLQRSIPPQYRIRLQCISVDYICRLDGIIALTWRSSLLKLCFESESSALILQAVKCVPYLLRSNLTLELTQPLLNHLLQTFGKSNVSVKRGIAEIIEKLLCTLSGSTVSRISESPKAESELVCHVCDEDQVYSPRKILGGEFYTLFKKLLEKISDDEDRGVKLAIIQAIPSLSKHLDVINEHGLVMKWLNLLKDPDYEVRLFMSMKVNFLVLPQCLSPATNDCAEKWLCIEHHIMVKWFNDIYDVIFDIMKCCLMKSRRDFQETMLLSVKNIGSVPWDYTLFPIVKLFVIFLIHPSSLIAQTIPACFEEFSKKNNLGPLQLYEKFRVEVCKVISCITVLSLSRKKFRFSSIVRKIACMFELGNAYDFLHGNIEHILPPLIPWIAKHKCVSILSEISFLMMTTVNQLLSKQFRFIYAHLYLNEEYETFQSCMDFIKEVGSLNLIVVGESYSESIQNQLILDLHSKPSKVLRGLADFIPDKDRSALKHGVNSEYVADFLQPRILGTLLFIDSLLRSSSSCLSTKQKALTCLPELIKLMGPRRLTPIKLKILTTLKTCLRITEGNFPFLTCIAWEAFVHNVELVSLGSMLSQIFISLMPLIDKFPGKIVAIFRYLVVQNEDVMDHYLADLYFVTKHPEMSDVYDIIQYHIDNFWPKDFRGSLTLLLKYITHDNVDVKVTGLKKLRQYVKEHQSELKDFVLNFGNEDTILADLIEALIIGCRDRDSRVRIACGECFGEIGAIDSTRLPRSSHQKEERAFIYDIKDEEFAVAALTKFTKAFMSARDTVDMDRFALAIQVFLQAYLSSIPTEPKKQQFWRKFPESMQQIMKPFQSTKYVLGSEICDYWKPHPIYGSNAGTSFQNWAHRWVCYMLTIEDDEFKLKVLSACRACLRSDMNVLIFLLPHIFLNAVIKANEEQSWKLIEEILAVMSSPSGDSKESTPQNSFKPIKLRSCTKMNIREDSPKEMRVMCLNTVFSLLDYLAKWVREWNRTYGRSQALKDPRPAIIKSFLDKINKLAISNRNFECREYPRSLLYLEQYVYDHEEELEEQFHFFEKIYARLNEPDAVAGVIAVQKQPPTIEQLILSHEANGQLQDAATCYEKMAESGCPETGYAMGMINCYLKLDQPHAALGLIKGLSTQRPDLAELLVESSVEALWKMSNWSELEKCLQNTEGNVGNLWNVSVGNALLNLRCGKSDKILINIDSMRETLMNSLCAISIDKGAYERGYQFIVRAQILSEIEKGSEVISNLKKMKSTCGEDIIKSFLKEWEGKLKYVQDSMSTLEPILSVRRIILDIISENIYSKHSPVLKMLENEIGQYWIKSAEISRNSGYFQQSYMYILNAEKYHIKSAFIEKAKLFWDKDNTNLALSTLRKGIAETFPNANQFKLLKDKIPGSDQKICAEAKLLLARFNDENINADIDDNMYNYKDCVETYTKWEKNLVYLAQYYDRVLDAIMADDEEKGIESQMHMINYFGKSLEFGCEYLFHSMPRMLTIWLDYGAKIANQKDKRDIFSNMTKLIETYSGRLPPFMFFSAFSQITTRLCHPHPLVYAVLKNIIAKVICTYPHQSLWMIMAVYKSSNSNLARKCSEIFAFCKKKDGRMIPMINEYIKLTDQLIALCNKQVSDGDQTTTLHKLSPSLSQMFKTSPRSKISLPLQKFISITMPLDLDAPQGGHNPFPREPVYISGIDERIYVFQSLQKPKKISFRGSDGLQYTLLCKAKDDLRKDLRVMEFNRIVNSYLQSDAEACQRFLHIRTYSVVPLNEDCGVIEWVPNLIGLRSLLSTIYAKMGKATSATELRKLMCALKDPLSKKRSVFLEKLLPRHPPVFDLWFQQTFSDPQGWYMARNAYTRTTAVMSIVGYVLGLGDRHGENVMFDSTNGDTVHVDFSCIFNMGEKFNWPERVPFRLTHNMVKAMGPNGIEGIFRRSCEIAMRILKRQSTTLIAVLTPFVYDPSMGSRGDSPESNSHEVTNKVAREHLHNINQRLQGYVSTKGGKFSLPLSTEGQVEKLISEATNVDNLCQMYIGWGAYL
ncbi:serine/threonine-protein kinase atr-like [Ischnura elegans]|uniref:serine/threonine-protein kinase atr-like n=1 Tax=Ischnura elegans TaxID=197161 RepID=UPI001ED8A9E2|nr:serine/threonine-protein kinase atr-like [Ischnura elegans]